jgi:multiple sugar transport system substrate-binding protein
MIKRVKELMRIASIFLMCIFIITGCSNMAHNKYGLDKNNPVSVKIWHYYNGVQKIEFDKMVEEFNDTLGKDEGCKDIYKLHTEPFLI